MSYMPPKPQEPLRVMSKRAHDAAESNMRTADSMENRHSKKARVEESSSTASTNQNDKTEKTTTTTTTTTTMGLSEVLSVEHAVAQLKTALKTILTTAPNSKQLEEIKEKCMNDPDSDPEILLAMNRNKLALAGQLVSLYEEKRLPLFDQILDFEQKHEVLPADMVLKLDSTFYLRKSNEEAKQDKVKEKETEGLPPLPQIRDRAIRSQVFFHKSLIKDKLFISKSEALKSHNERLEFVGDSIMNNIMTLIVYNAFPDAAEGELSKMRVKLINNETLQKWALQYGFHKELRMNTDQSVMKGKMKIFADVFEAYIGGLVTESTDNYPIIFEWLRQLAQPLLKNSNEYVTKPLTGKEPLHNNSKSELYSMIGYAALGLHYEVVEKIKHGKDSYEFVVQVKTKDGDVLGEGTGMNSKEAGARAAMAALEDKAIIEKYTRLRASIPRPISAQVDKSRSKQKKGGNPKGNEGEETEGVTPSPSGVVPARVLSASNEAATIKKSLSSLNRPR